MAHFDYNKYDHNRNFKDGRLPRSDRVRCFVISDIANDRTKSALERLQSIATSTQLFLSEDPRGRNLSSRILATISHRTAKLHKELLKENRRSRQRHANPNLANVKQIADIITQGKIGEFNSQSIANTAWAFATLGIKNDPLFGALGTATQKKIGEFNSQDITNTAWAFATLGIKNDPLFGTLGTATQKKIGEFNSQDITNTAWAFATLGIKNDPFFGALGTAAQKKIGEFNSQSIANTAWAFATLGIKDDDFFGALGTAAQKKIGELNSQSIANTAWAFATLGIKDDDLFGALGTAAQRKIGEFNSQDIANTAWAFATLGIKDDALFRALGTAAQKKMGEFNAQDIANTAWAFVFGAPNLVVRVCAPLNLQKFSNPMGWLQGYHALIVAGAVNPSDPQPRLQEIEAGYTPEKLNNFERDVSKWLSSEVGIPINTISHHRPIAGIVTDLVIEHNGQKVIVECDGDQYHLTSGPNGGTRLGRDLIQDLVFEKFGYTVVHIRYSEFQQSDREQLARRVQKVLGR